MLRYLKTDCYRMLKSGKWFIGILIVASVYLIAAWIERADADVILLWFYANLKSFTAVSYIGAVYAFGGVFREDIEHKFIFQEAAQGTITKYVMSKCLVCLLSSEIVMIGGTLLFAETLSMRIPLNRNIGKNFFLQSDGQWDFLNKILASDHIWGYLIFASAIGGMLAGLLTLLAVYFSLWVTNYLFVYCVPVTLYYFIINYVSNWLKASELFNLREIFCVFYQLWDTGMKSFAYAVFVYLVLGGLLFYAIEKRVNKVIHS